MITTASRLNGIEEYYFSQKLKEIQQLNQQGKAIINLGIGNPDLPPHPDVVRALGEEAAKNNVHGYQSYIGAEILRTSLAKWYKEWYAVDLDPASEVLPLIGSKEGIMHLCMTYLNEGDEALIPNPGYPTYKSAVKLAGGKCVEYDLVEENNWAIDFDVLDRKDLSKVKLMWVNYPHMPTGILPTKKTFEELISFGKKNNILICHDNAYSLIQNKNPMSILSVDGAKDTAVELNSLSKSHNMAGWRIGFLCGAKERINEVLRFKSNMDSGMFLPLQLAAAKALTLSKDWFETINNIYAKRKHRVLELLDALDCSYSTQQGGLFIWAKVPKLYKDGYELSDKVLYEAGVFITPGGIFGEAGNNFIRISLCSSEEIYETAIKKIKQLKAT